MKTKHDPSCKMAFGRKDPSCPRCQELLAGAPPRKGWNHTKREQERRQIEAIERHDCRVSGCGVVCTFGDW